MKKHLYNTSVGKVRWFIKRFGAAEVLRKPIRTIFAPALIRSLPRATFSFDGRQLEYLYHKYNMTWACERCVEVPIALAYLSSRPLLSQALEIGNVLSHYRATTHLIVDKYEKGPGVLNQDILEFQQGPFDLIVSVSTFEHIGYDDVAEGGSSRDKIMEAVRHVRTLLGSTGQAVITVPIGYNPDVDGILADNAWAAKRSLFLKRTAFTKWEQTERETALPLKYRSRFPYANAICVAEFDRVNKA